MVGSAFNRDQFCIQLASPIGGETLMACRHERRQLRRHDDLAMHCGHCCAPAGAQKPGLAAAEPAQPWMAADIAETQNSNVLFRSTRQPTRAVSVGKLIWKREPAITVNVGERISGSRATASAPRPLIIMRPVRERAWSAERSDGRVIWPFGACNACDASTAGRSDRRRLHAGATHKMPTLRRML
jgi:hypothetical protein